MYFPFKCGDSIRICENELAYKLPKIKHCGDKNALASDVNMSYVCIMSGRVLPRNSSTWFTTKTTDEINGQFPVANHACTRYSEKEGN